eukprot:gb/GECG01003122.1/.p1 GENE.gb/GECG01003122.1/~~gb/GECG01003122.1/.p1  ORF type:complete len:428 (+),score=39.67 gb/GECG01003122.1/:1-1284(+)
MATDSLLPPIRTITVFVTLDRNSSSWWTPLESAVSYLRHASDHLKGAGYEIQTTRIATNSFEEYALDLSNAESSQVDTVIQNVQRLVQIVQELTVKYGFGREDVLLNIGRASSVHAIEMISRIIQQIPSVTASANISLVDFKTANAAAQVISALSKTTSNGNGNFNFSATSRCPPLIPFFPTAFAPSVYNNPDKEIYSGIGLELAGLVVKACGKSVKELQQGRTMTQSILEIGATELRRVLEDQISKVHTQAIAASEGQGIKYQGIDTSIAPSPGGASLVDGFELLGSALYSGYKFGQSGSLAIAAMMTGVIRSLDVHAPHGCIGYNGLMLPPLEDTGLANRAEEKTYGIRDLLSLSSVCGIGLDTVPIGGDSSVGSMSALITDVASLSHKWDKPLSCRLFPVVGKHAGEMTEFSHPHLCNGAIFEL